MAITQPPVTSTATQCLVLVSGGTEGTSLSIPLSSDQIADWSDDELVEKIGALSDAIAAFCPPDTVMQSLVGWNFQGSVTTYQNPAPDTPPEPDDAA
ncbi:hypothetical protein [Streptomyces sp. DW26H14]|uniref:hypothetical protein n=1 Tax=Streptomyces sp. DW26H14 TaxID=3435395 RepID=UPI00403E1734